MRTPARDPVLGDRGGPRPYIPTRALNRFKAERGAAVFRYRPDTSAADRHPAMMTPLGVAIAMAMPAIPAVMVATVMPLVPVVMPTIAAVIVATVPAVIIASAVVVVLLATTMRLRLRGGADAQAGDQQASGR